MPTPSDPNGLVSQILADDNTKDIGNFLDLKGLASASVTDKGLNGIFQPILVTKRLVEYVLHGNEALVKQLLVNLPAKVFELKNNAIDLSGRQFTSVTPIQAAICANDFAPNENSTGIFELLVIKLKEQHPEDWPKKLHDQTLEIYKKSLSVYLKKQDAKINMLENKQRAGEAVNSAMLTTEKERHQAYQDAWNSNDLNTIINAHTNPDLDPTKAPDAQKDHAIEVKQELIDAIANASNDAIQAVLNDPTIDTTLSNLIKAFREEVDTICRSEIINNPQHLIKLFELYNNFYDRVGNTDPHWKKRELFWCHLVGYVQRYLSASDAQIFANPGLFAMVEQRKINQRSFNFKFDGGSIFPLAFDSHSGLGYKFAVTGVGRAWPSRRLHVSWTCGCGARASFTKLMSSKNRKLSETLYCDCNPNCSPTLNFAV